MTAALVAKTPVPTRIPFVKGEEVVYVNPMNPADRWPTRVQRVVNVQGLTERIRYYALESARGVLVPADRLLHTWEG